MPPFTNEVISIDSLPKYEEAGMTPVQKKYWNVMVINFLITFLVISGMITGLFLLRDTPEYFRYIFIGYLVLMIIVFFLRKVSFAKRSFAIRERDIIYRHGILSTITTIIPFSRIQHVSINEGLFSRYYQLAQLQIYTAGGATSDLKISGLLKSDAEQLKEMIMLQIINKEQNVNNEDSEV